MITSPNNTTMVQPPSSIDIDNIEVNFSLSQEVSTVRIVIKYNILYSYLQYLMGSATGIARYCMIIFDTFARTIFQK
jgi:hypothetical protein